jgi:hypothetical protein
LEILIRKLRSIQLRGSSPQHSKELIAMNNNFKTKGELINEQNRNNYIKEP